MFRKTSDEYFVALLMASQAKVYQFLLMLVRNRQDAEDLLQQSCMVIWKDRASYDPARGEFSKWACGIALNQVRNFRRKEANRRHYLSEAAAEQLLATQQAHGPYLDECHQALHVCLEKLTPHQRTLVEESYGNGPLKSAASATGRTPNAIYKTLRHIRNSLYDCIQSNLAKGGAA